MLKSKMYLLFVIMMITAITLSACGERPEPNDGNPLTNVVAIPKPEPPAIIISVPYTLQELAMRCGTAKLASADFIPSAMPQDCADFMRHGLRAKRLAEFAALNISVEAIMSAIGQGVYEVQNSGADGTTTALHMIVNGIRVIMMFGGVSNPTIFPIPNLKYGETLAESIAKWFTGENARFSTPVEITNQVKDTIMALARCVTDQLRSHSIPEPVTSPAPMPVPTAEPVEFSASTMTINTESTFVVDTSNSNAGFLTNLSTEEIQVLMLVGTVVVVGAVIIATCGTTGCTTTAPVLALVALVP
jgi:hypothetical protein